MMRSATTVTATIAGSIDDNVYTGSLTYNTGAANTYVVSNYTIPAG
jgi:hypothetical protein